MSITNGEPIVVIYGGVSIPGPEGQARIESAVNKLIQAESPGAVILWSMKYTQLGRLSNDGTSPEIQTHSPHVYSFPPPSLDIAFEDDLVEIVKESWLKVAGSDVNADDFMIFDDREGTSDE